MLITTKRVKQNAYLTNNANFQNKSARESQSFTLPFLTKEHVANLTFLWRIMRIILQMLLQVKVKLWLSKGSGSHKIGSRAFEMLSQISIEWFVAKDVSKYILLLFYWFMVQKATKGWSIFETLKLTWTKI